MTPNQALRPVVDRKHLAKRTPWEFAKVRAREVVVVGAGIPEWSIGALPTK